MGYAYTVGVGYSLKTFISSMGGIISKAYAAFWSVNYVC